MGDTKVRFYGFPTGASAPVVAPEVAGHRPQAPVEHGCAPDWCTLLPARPGAGGRGSGGAAGRGQRRQGTGGAPPGAGGEAAADHQEEGLGHQQARLRGGVAGGSLQSVGRQLVKGVVLIHQTCSPASAQSMEDLSLNLILERST